MNVFFKIEQKQIHMKTYHLLPGGEKCQDPFTFEISLNGEADGSAKLQRICYRLKQKFKFCIWATLSPLVCV